MHRHTVQPCPLPKPKKRWRNLLWICPICEKPWILRFSVEEPSKVYPADGDFNPITYDSPSWVWWPFVFTRNNGEFDG